MFGLTRPLFLMGSGGLKDWGGGGGTFFVFLLASFLSDAVCRLQRHKEQRSQPLLSHLLAAALTRKTPVSDAGATRKRDKNKKVDLTKERDEERSGKEKGKKKN